MTKLVEPWWDLGLNPITGLRTQDKQYNRKDVVSDEVKYFNAYPKLKTKCTTY